MDGEKSRREKRKEARLERNKKKFHSWVQHQAKKDSWNNKSDKINNSKKGAHTSETNIEVVPVEFRRGTSRSLDEYNLLEELGVDKDEVSIFNAVVASKKNKSLNKRQRIELERNLGLGRMESTLFEQDLAWEKKLAKKLKVKNGKLGGVEDELLEGIPSVLDLLVEEEIPKEVSRKGTKNKTSKMKTKTCKLMKNKNLNIASDSMEHTVNLDTSKIEVDSLDGKKTSPKSPKECYAHKKHKKELCKEELNVEVVEGSMVRVAGQTQTSGIEGGSERVSSKVATPGRNSKFVVPQLRNQSEEFSRVSVRVRGLLNRFTELNVESITEEVFMIFQNVGHLAISQIIIEEVISSCSEGPCGNEQYAAVFAAFVAGMSCMGGIDFGAKVLAFLAKRFEDEYLKEDNLSLRNLTLLLSYLYIFGVCSSDLIYDFLIMLSKRLKEVDVSIILTILQCCGMRLRSDDPATMENFIRTIQGRVNELKVSQNSSSSMSSKRMKFLLEEIYDIKNNRKRPKEVTVQHTQITKWLQKLRVEDILIRGIKWNRLLDPDKKGQWWLSRNLPTSTENIEEVTKTIDKGASESQKMLQLVASQQMNTDSRRAIFCIIMSSEDYIDAFEKLLRLDLPGKQDREIMRVLVECCLQEKVFNKYYCVLASKLCDHDKNHKFTLQYCIWDHIKELDSMHLQRSMHLAKFVAEMLASFSLSLMVLKVVDLSDPTWLTPKRVIHFRMLFEAIFEFSDRLVWNIFTRIAITPEYETLRDGFEIFVKKYVLDSHKSFSEKFKLTKKALNNVEGVLK